jgi:hypothetical protein
MSDTSVRFKNNDLGCQNIAGRMEVDNAATQTVRALLVHSKVGLKGYSKL